MFSDCVPWLAIFALAAFLTLFVLTFWLLKGDDE